MYVFGVVLHVGKLIQDLIKHQEISLKNINIFRFSITLYSYTTLLLWL